MLALSGMAAGKAISNVFSVVQMGEQGKLMASRYRLIVSRVILMAYLSKFITWWGFLTPLVALGGVYVGEVFLSGFNSGFQLGVFLAGLVNFIFGYLLNHRSKQEPIAGDDGLAPSNRGMWLFLPMQWWSIPMLLYGLTGLIGFTGGI